MIIYSRNCLGGGREKGKEESERDIKIYFFLIKFYVIFIIVKIFRDQLIIYIDLFFKMEEYESVNFFDLGKNN